MININIRNYLLSKKYLIVVFFILIISVILSYVIIYNSKKNYISFIDACSKGNSHLVEKLINKGIDVNNKSVNERVALVEASKNNNVDVVQLLINNGADVNLQDYSERSALMTASETGNISIVQLLVENGASIDERNSSGFTSLMLAAQASNLLTVKTLVDYGADIKALDKDGNSALMAACSSSKNANKGADIAEFLLEKGADVNHANKWGFSPLMKAAASGSLECVKLLFYNGADMRAIAASGQDAMTMALSKGHLDVFNFIDRNGGGIQLSNDPEQPIINENTSGTPKNLLKNEKLTIDITPKNLDLLHSLPYDKRLVEGLRLAFSQAIRLLEQKPSKETYINESVRQLNKYQYQITYNVTLNGLTEQYTQYISNRPDNINNNLSSLENILRDFIKKHKYEKQIATFINQGSPMPLPVIEGKNFTFEYTKLFNELLSLENQFINGNDIKGSLFNAGEIYSWLALFKNVNPRQEIADQLASYAISYYLLGSLGKQENDHISFYKGLLLLCLDYPAAAQQVLTSSTPYERLLSAYIQNNFKELITFEQYQDINQRLVLYLTARAYYRSYQNNVAYTYFNKLLDEYPNFHLAKEYIAGNGSVGISGNLAEAYLIELIEEHLNLFNIFFKDMPSRYDAEIKTEMQKRVSEQNKISKWLRVHNLLTNRNNELKEFKYFLDPDLLTTLMKEDVATALLAIFDVENRKLARDEKAASILEMVEKIYPGSSIAKVLHFQKRRHKHRNRRNILENLSSRNIDRHLLNNIIDYYDKGAPSDSTLNRFILLRKFKEAENPNARGLFALAMFYQKCFYKPYVKNCLKNGLLADPYNYRFYEELFKFDGVEKAIKDGKAILGHQYGFLLALADWYLQKDMTAEAISSYRSAISISPRQFSAYQDLGDFYINNGQPEKAIDTWQRYLEFDNSSLYAVALKNKIGKSLMNNGEYSKAYQVFLESKDSWQAEALLYFAEISEKTGKTLQAEEYYKNAVKRYPYPLCTSKLGVFYLRQNNRKMAYETFRKFKSYSSSPSYYIPELVKYYIDLGTPEQAIKEISKIEGDRFSKYHTDIAKEFALHSKNELAVSESRKAILGASYQNLRDLVRLVEHDIVTQNMTLDQFLEQYPSARQSFDLEYIGDHLVMNRLYNLAYDFYKLAFAEGHYISEKTKEHILLKLILIWRHNNREPSEKKEIEDQTSKFFRHKWFQSCVGYMLGQLDKEELLSHADSQNKKGEAYYYFGFSDYMKGYNDSALQKFLISLESMDSKNDEYQLAYRLVKKLSEQN